MYISGKITHYDDGHTLLNTKIEFKFRFSNEDIINRILKNLPGVYLQGYSEYT